ncbi:MAG: sulfite exporter TauE/SafE family protein [Clostridia bacterium]|nr:sulfite exporter TauE/SafE family protein [Clostridia bacterium]
MTPLGYLISFLTAIPAGAGIGGGGLFIIYLVSAGYSQTVSGALNLIFFLSAASCALPFHITKRKLSPRIIFAASFFGSLGCLLGGTLRTVISEGFVRVFFGVLLIFTGFRSLFREKITNFPDFPSTRP